MPAMVALPDLDRNILGIHVGGHDRFSGEFQIVRFQLVANTFEAGADLVHRQRPANDTGGEGQDIISIDAQFGADDAAGLDGVVDALLAHGDVGVLAVDHQRLSKTAGDMFAPDNNWRARKTITRKHRRRPRSDRRINNGQVERRVFNADVFGEGEKPLRVVKFIGSCVLHCKRLLQN